MLELKLLAMVVAALGAVGAALGRARIRRALRRRMLRGEAVIADHALVTLVGKVRAIGEPLIAPLSGTSCVLHVSTVRIFDGRTSSLLLGVRRGREVIATHTRSEMVDFILVTRAGEVRVCGSSADITLPAVPVVPRDLERELAFLAEVGMRSVRGADAASSEVVVEPGATISVHGVARVAADPAAASAAEAGYRDAPTTVRIEGDAANPLIIAER